MRERMTTRPGSTARRVAVLGAVLALACWTSTAVGVKRGAEAVDCGGGAGTWGSNRAHDSIGQGAIGDMATGGGLRIHDGFWLILPSINVPVEGAFFATCTESGTAMLRWTVPSLADIVEFNVYRSTSDEGPYARVNEEPLAALASGFFEDATVWPETTFWYELRAMLASGLEEPVAGSPARVTTGGKLAFSLHPVWPNPFTEEARIRFDIPSEVGPTGLTIYNSLGQEVARIVDGPVARGRHELAWNGCDKSGHRVSSGVYFVKLDHAGAVESQKVIMLR